MTEAKIIEFDAHKVRNYLDRTLNSFLNDPPDTDYQRAYLAAIINVWREALGNTKDSRAEVLETLL